MQGAINIGASTGFPVKLIGTPFKSVIWFQTICLFETIEVRRKRTENSLLGLGQSQIQTRMMFDFGRAPLTTSEHLRTPPTTGAISRVFLSMVSAHVGLVGCVLGCGLWSFFSSKTGEGEYAACRSDQRPLIF